MWVTIVGGRANPNGADLGSLMSTSEPSVPSILVQGEDMPAELVEAMQAYPSDITLCLEGEQLLHLHRPIIAMTSAVLREAVATLAEGEKLQVRGAGPQTHQACI